MSNLCLWRYIHDFLFFFHFHNFKRIYLMLYQTSAHSFFQTLCHLKVENLVIPSAEGVEGMWINKFHFSQYIDKSLEKDIFLSNMLKFPRTIILQKSLLQNAQSSHIGGLSLFLYIYISNFCFVLYESDHFLFIYFF